jgi:integrase
MMLRDVAANLGHLPPRHITEAACLGIINRWRDRYAQSTLYALRQHLRRFLDMLETCGAPRIALPKIKPGKPRRVIATAVETAQLLKHAQPHLRLLLLLWRHLGLRFHEGTQLAPQNFNAEKHEITFVKKGGEEHTLPTTPDIEALFAIAPDEGPAIPYVHALRGAGGKTDDTLRHQYEQLRKKLGINPNLQPHDLRRTLAVAIYDRTNDIRAVSQVLGHESLASTASYLQHRDTAKLRGLLKEMRTPTETTQ